LKTLAERPAPQLMESLPHRFRNQQEDRWAEPSDIGSDAGLHIARFKRSVVLDLYLRQGTAWKEVRAFRERWAITPTVQLPPKKSPLSMHYPEYGWPREYDAEGGQNREWVELASRWGGEIHALAQRFVPEHYRPDPLREELWVGFMSACVVYDPPEVALLTFAERGGPVLLGLSPTDKHWVGFGNPYHAMLAPPIRTLRDGDKSESLEGWFWEQVIKEIQERFLEPAGMNIREMMREIFDSSPSLLKRYQDLRKQETPYRHYIAVGEETTADDVQRAFKLISATLPERSRKGAPRRDPLIALQCAILHDRHNARDPEDRRRWRWSYERLAEEFRLGSGETKKAKEQVAADYVALGRNLLEDSQDETTT
jgi:hypothetical protein